MFDKRRLLFWAVVTCYGGYCHFVGAYNQNCTSFYESLVQCASRRAQWYIFVRAVCMYWQFAWCIGLGPRIIFTHFTKFACIYCEWRKRLHKAPERLLLRGSLGSSWMIGDLKYNILQRINRLWSFVLVNCCNVSRYVLTKLKKKISWLEYLSLWIINRQKNKF